MNAHKIFFSHNPKAAGSSVSVMIEAIAGPRRTFLVERRRRRRRHLQHHATGDQCASHADPFSLNHLLVGAIAWPNL
jgi:hypothetical protein